MAYFEDELWKKYRHGVYNVKGLGLFKITSNVYGVPYKLII